MLEPHSLTTDLVLAIVHHILVFAYFGILVAELTLSRPGITGSSLSKLAMVDGASGMCAFLIVAVGICRVIFGIKGPQYYMHNPWFWGKMSAFLMMGLLSIVPTISVLRWRKSGRAEPGFTPDERAVSRVRRFVMAEFAFLAIVLVCAATMARVSHA